MKITSKAIRDFIQDFHFNEDSEYLCFSATIYFTDHYHSVQVQAEVQVKKSIIMESYDIYLLHPDIISEGFPDSFNDQADNIIYIKDLCLLIKGKIMFVGKFVLSIHPDGSDCSSTTLKELHQKEYN